MPLERLGGQICELAGHLAAATCGFLVLLADFDARRGWESWEMASCAQWRSWKCRMSSGTAREHVRVARALAGLPVIRGEFGAGRLPDATVRALTRIATPETDAGLAEMASPMTGDQLERFARAHRRVSRADVEKGRVWPRLTWRFEDDGSLAGSFRLPPVQAAVLLQALQAATAGLEPEGGVSAGPPGDVSAGTPVLSRPPEVASSRLAQALVLVAEVFLREKTATADDPAPFGGPGPAGGPGGPGPLSCPGRPGARPGGGSRRVDLHHIQYWSNGGRTDLGNLVSLCRRHHTAVHDRGHLIAAHGSGFTFSRADGITPDTIIPPWYGERLDLHYAIAACFATAQTPSGQRRNACIEEDDLEPAGAAAGRQGPASAKVMSTD